MSETKQPVKTKKKGYYLPTIILGIIVAIIFLLAIFTYQVPAPERALILTMGKITGTAEPGLHFRWPLPFQEIIRYDIRKRTFDGNIGRLEETTTKDQKQVVIGINVVYRIKDLVRFKTASSFSAAEDYLGSRMRTAKAAVIGKYDYNQLINTDPEKMKLEEMRKEILDYIAEDVMERYGLEVTDVLFSAITVPEKTADAIASRMKQERETEAARKRDEGKTRAAQIRTEADTEKSKILTLAQAEAKNMMAKGDAEAAQHYAVFTQEPELAVFLRKLQAMKKVLATRSTLILGTNAAPFDIFNGPVIKPATRENATIQINKAQK